MKLYGNMNFEVNPDNVESYILYFLYFSKNISFRFLNLNRVFCALSAILQSLLHFNTNKDILQSHDVTQK